MNQLSCAVAVCSSLRRRHHGGGGGCAGGFTETFESCFSGRDRRVKGMKCACHRDKDDGLDGNKRGAWTWSASVSDRAPLTVLPGNSRLFSPESSRV